MQLDVNTAEKIAALRQRLPGRTAPPPAHDRQLRTTRSRTFPANPQPTTCCEREGVRATERRIGRNTTLAQKQHAGTSETSAYCNRSSTTALQKWRCTNRRNTTASQKRHCGITEAMPRLLKKRRHGPTDATQQLDDQQRQATPRNRRSDATGRSQTIVVAPSAKAEAANRKAQNRPRHQ